MSIVNGELLFRLFAGTEYSCHDCANFLALIIYARYDTVLHFRLQFAYCRQIAIWERRKRSENDVIFVRGENERVKSEKSKVAVPRRYN